MSRPSVAIVALLLLASLAPGLQGSGQGVDCYGRPLFDGDGPISYRWDGGRWIARLGDGSFVPAEGPEPAPGVPFQPRHSSYTLGAYSEHPVGSWPEAVAIGDVTADGVPDVVMTTTFYFDDENDYHVFVYPQQPSGSLGSPAKYPYRSTANRNGLVLADLDEDGVLDVVVGHGTGITVLLADGLGGLETGVVYVDGDAMVLAATDVDLDTHLDVISLGWSRGATVFYGDGNGGFRETEPLSTHASGYNDMEVEDLGGDCWIDLAVMSGQGAAPTLTVHPHDGVGGFDTALDQYWPGGSADGVGLGDVTGDGRHDAVLSRGRNSPTYLWIYEQDVTGSLAGPSTITSYDIPETVEVADMDGDRTEDVAVLHGGWNRIGLYLQDPSTGLDSEQLYVIPYASHYAPQGLAVGDYSADGCGDAAIADYNHGLVTLYGQNCFTPGPDRDGDGVPDDRDNCPDTANPDQRDTDCDGRGDACDTCPGDPLDDEDGDGVCGNEDNCPGIANSNQLDSDGDGAGDACDPCPDDVGNDVDGDTVCESDDNCPTTSNPLQTDSDGDGAGDACDPCPNDPLDDADADGHCADVDNCPDRSNPGQEDRDGDGAGDLCDPCPDDPLDDADTDGHCADVDNCPDTYNPDQDDLDGDGLGDVCDPDADGDGLDNRDDCAPLDGDLWEVPGEVASLQVEVVPPPAIPGTIRLAWTDERLNAGPATRFDLTTGRLDHLAADAGFLRSACLAPSLDAAEIQVAVFASQWFLVRARSGCGDGTWGVSYGTGNERDYLEDPATDPCP